MTEVMAAVSTVINRKVTFEQMPYAESYSLLQGLGFPEWLSHDLAYILLHCHAFEAGVDSSDLISLLPAGHLPYSIEQYIAGEAASLVAAQAAGVAERHVVKSATLVPKDEL